ncbi:hypothetical protein [Actinomyces radicidentis]|uniref:hypothetical protein n=1 Tax=Actinomyces radicidentis TaxID=111015 RepID=UPI0028E62F50|nr:hypothetical protein [Actinomyces radicidentis]
MLAHELGAPVPVSEASLAAVRTEAGYRDAVEEIRQGYDPGLTGLDEPDWRALASTQRPSELAGLVVRGLSARAGSRTTPGNEHE